MAINKFPEPMGTFTNVLFCPTNSPKHEEIQFTVIAE